MEDALFKVPKNHFATSDVFATIFSLPPEESGVEGTECKPFVLQGISEVDFESLLKLMYPSPLTTVKLTQQEWISVLKLCTMWEFTEIRDRAIRELSTKEISIGTIEKIEYGKAYAVKEWVLDGYVELLKRSETITEQEAERLGWKTAAKLLLLREQYISDQHSAISNWTCGGCQQCKSPPQIYCTPYRTYYPCPQQVTDRNQHDFTKAVQKEFGTEL